MGRALGTALAVAMQGVGAVVAGNFEIAACDDAERRAEQRVLSRAAANQMATLAETSLREVAPRTIPRPTDAPSVSQVIVLPPPTPIPARSPEPRPLGAPTATPMPRVTAVPTPTPTPPPTDTPNATTLPRPTGVLARVVRVVDGDTIDVQINGYVERVRLLKVDTPERGCPFFESATAFVRERVAGRQVVLQFPSGTPEWDVYGRLLAEVQYQRGGRVMDLGSELLEAGLAVPYVPGGPDCLPPG